MSLDNAPINGQAYDAGPIPCERSTISIFESSMLNGTDRLGQKWTKREMHAAILYHNGGLTVDEIAVKLGRSKGSICGALRRAELAGLRDSRRGQYDWTPEAEKRLTALWKGPLTTKAIAKQFGLSDDAIRARAHRLNLGRRRAVRAVRGDGRIMVPGWVPKSLHEEYIAVAEEDGEFAAASWARAEKRAMAA